jgi:hypothetical protein
VRISYPPDDLVSIARLIGEEGERDDGNAMVRSLHNRPTPITSLVPQKQSGRHEEGARALAPKHAYLTKTVPCTQSVGPL